MLLTYNGQLLNSNGKFILFSPNVHFWLSGYDTGTVYEYNLLDYSYTGNSHNLYSISPGYLTNPFRCRDIAKSTSGNFLVAENLYDRIYEYTSEWQYIGYHYVGDKETTLSSIHQGINGHYYIAGQDSDAVHEYDGSWNFIQSFSIAAQSSYCQGIWQRDNGDWYVLDSFSDYVYKYNSSFVYSGTRYNTKFGSPTVHGTNGYGLAFYDNFWYIIDIDFEEINKYTDSFTYVSSSPTLTQDGVFTGITISTN